LWRLHVQETANARGDVIEFVHFEGQFHAMFTAKGVDEERVARSFGAFEQESSSAGSSFWSKLRLRALDDFDDFQHRIDFSFHAAQLAFLLQALHKFPQICVSHYVPPGSPSKEFNRKIPRRLLLTQKKELA
jgi:hypothetical protein